MFHAKKYIACMAFLAALMSMQPAFPQGKLKKAQTRSVQTRLAGVWKVTEFATPVPSVNSVITTTAQPGIFIFTKRNYSIMYVSSSKPRPRYPQQNPTEAQKVAAWEPFSANAGTYEIKGSILTTHPLVAKNPAVMAPGAFVNYTFKFEGNTLLLTPKDSNTVPGANPPTFKLTRLE